VRYAVVAVNPNSQYVHRHYPDHISPSVDAWPVIYRSEDILIKEIPDE